MFYCGYNNFYMANRYFMGGCAPFNSCRGSGFGTGVKLGILSYLSGISSPFNMNMNFGFGFGMNNGYSTPSFSYNSTPSVFGFGNSTPYSSYTPPVNTTTFGDILRMYNYGSAGNYNNSYNNYNYSQNQTFDFGIYDTEQTTESSKSSKSSYSTQSVSTDFKLDKQFIDRVKEIAKNLNCDYKDLLAVMNSESGINPHKWNGKTAVGLIQFTNYSLADIKRVYGESYTKEQVGNMSGMEQLDLVEKYLKLAKSYSFSKDAKLSAGDLYAVVFAPSIASNEVLYKKGSDAYAQNPLDLDGDGVISKTDLANHLAKKQVNLVA